MKKFLKGTFVTLFALLLTFTTATKAFAHSPTDPENSSMFTVVQFNSSNGWTRGYIFQPNIFLQNDGPLFLGDAVSNLDWEMTRPGSLSVNAIFDDIEQYRIVVYSPVNGQIFFDQMYTNTDSPSAHVDNLNAGKYRILVYNYTNTYFLLNQYTISAEYN